MPTSPSIPSPSPEKRSETAQEYTEQATLRLTIDGAWTATDMIDSFAALRDVYDLLFMLLLERSSIPSIRRAALIRQRGVRRKWEPYLTAYGGLDTKNLDSIDSLLFPQERLVVVHVQYGSLGFKDILGAGEVIGHLRSFTEKIIDLFATRRKRRLEDDLLEAELEAKRIENARAVVELARKVAYSSTEIRQAVAWVDRRQVSLSRLVGEGKILGVQTLQPGSA